MYFTRQSLGHHLISKRVVCLAQGKKICAANIFCYCLKKKRLIICMYYAFALECEEEGGGGSCRFVVYK